MRPLSEQVPWLGVAEMNSELPGSVSVTEIDACEVGPAFLTVPVNVIAESALTDVALAFWLLPAPTGLRSGRLGHEGVAPAWVHAALAAALLVLGVLALVWVVLTGDAGTRAVWGS